MEEPKQDIHILVSRFGKPKCKNPDKVLYNFNFNKPTRNTNEISG